MESLSRTNSVIASEAAFAKQTPKTEDVTITEAGVLNYRGKSYQITAFGIGKLTEPQLAFLKEFIPKILEKAGIELSNCSKVEISLEKGEGAEGTKACI